MAFHCQIVETGREKLDGRKRQDQFSSENSQETLQIAGLDQTIPVDLCLIRSATFSARTHHHWRPDLRLPFRPVTLPAARPGGHCLQMIPIMGTDKASEG